MLDNRLKEPLARLRDAAEADGPLNEAWQDWCRTAQDCAATPPAQLEFLLGNLTKFTDRPKHEITILDHGCGAGNSLLFALGLGYTGIFGVDVNPDLARHWKIIHRVLREIHGDAKPRLTLYDGGALPFDDASFDLIFSQQVLEHVGDEYLEMYYVEEGRVLRNGGLACHEVPHRLSPFDGHTRRWLLHYLPAYRTLWRISGISKFTVGAVHLRWPSVHLRYCSQHIGETKNRKRTRLLSKTEIKQFDGPIRLRRLLAWVFALPVIGPALATPAASFFMLETESIRSDTRS